MTRYKGRQNAKAVERDFPHFVDIVVPLGGLGSKLDVMYDDANGSVIRWCFADLKIAEAFAEAFKR